MSTPTCCAGWGPRAGSTSHRRGLSVSSRLTRTIHEFEPTGRLQRPIASLLVAHGTLLAYPLRSSRLALGRFARPDTPSRTTQAETVEMNFVLAGSVIFGSPS